MRSTPWRRWKPHTKVEQGYWHCATPTAAPCPLKFEPLWGRSVRGIRGKIAAGTDDTAGPKRDETAVKKDKCHVGGIPRGGGTIYRYAKSRGVSTIWKRHRDSPHGTRGRSEPFGLIIMELWWMWANPLRKSKNGFHPSCVNPMQNAIRMTSS